MMLVLVYDVTLVCAGKWYQYITSHPTKLSLAIPLWLGVMVTVNVRECMFSMFCITVDAVSRSVGELKVPAVD